MPEFVLEIGVEEMPARFVPKLRDELASLLTARLDESMVSYGEVTTYATPRRITACIADVAEERTSQVEEVTGPPRRIAFDDDGNLTKAGQGFAKTQGVDESDLYVVETGKGEYLAAKKTLGGGRAVEVLPEICADAVGHLSFPKKMKWGSLDFHFGRPMRWLLALMGDTVVDFEMAGLRSSNETTGHRVMGRGPFSVPSAEKYVQVVTEQGKVTLDPEVRKAQIIEEGNAQAKQVGGSIVWTDSLLDEVSNLVEYPRPILGSIDAKYLQLPRQVLLTSMQSHQKSFGVEDANGDLLPYFLTTLNLNPEDLDLVRKGWERVLKARLEDARFFWEADNATDLDVWLNKLENVVFLGPLGSMGDKTRRLEKLCRKIAQRIHCDTLPADIKAAGRAGRLAKADLVSEMVNEFDSLQGIMGGIYASRKGESEFVAQALAEQYLPAGPESPVPSSLGGAILSMADKADTLAGCFGLKKIPTGANDPYALRRAVLGISRIILHHGLDLDVMELLRWAQEGYTDVRWKLEPKDALEQLGEFFSQRLRAYFTGKGYATRVVTAAIGAGFADVRVLQQRIEALDGFSRSEDFEQAVLTFKRAANIIRKQGEESGADLSGNFEPDMLQEDAEKVLADKLEETGPRFEERWQQGDFRALFAILGELRPAVDGFFDNVMVMCDDAALRSNRLNLLKALVDRLSRLADFSQLQV